VTRVAVVGATGAVGTTMVRILSERRFPVEDLRLMASARSAGEVVATPWGDVKVEALDDADPGGIEVALFSAGAARSREHAPRFAEAGAVVIDNSSAFRMDPAVPLVVSGVNDHAAAGHDGIIANPNCTTMVLMMAVGPLHRAATVRHMVATTYQSVSGAGRTGMGVLAGEIDLLATDPDALAGGGWVDPGGDLYPRPIGFNVIPHAGPFTEGGYTEEEWKLVNETRKILGDGNILVEPTCVRVPVMVGHSVAATLEFERAMGTAEALDHLSAAPGVEVWRDDKVPTPLDSAGVDNTLVGRVRGTLGRPGGISLWAVGDNLRKGAALNAVQIAELLLSTR
jgi:aspartate-semialdehyde dehydrogenase